MASGKNTLVAVPIYRAILLLLLGYYDQARTQIALALAEAKGLKRTQLLAFALERAAWFHVLLDEDAPHLLDAFNELATELAAEQDFPYWAASVLQYRGLALARAGETRKGIAFVREGIAQHDAMGAVWHVPVVLVMTADLVGGVEGVALLEDAAVRLARTGVRFFDAEMRRVRGTLLAEGGDPVGAEAQFLEAVQVAQDQGAKHWELRAATDLTRLWRNQGKRTEAHDLLAPVYDWFTEGFDTPDLKEAKALLDELGK
jgi:predicted ATPase